MAHHCSNFKCAICLQQFSVIEELERHMTRHDIHHPFRCNFCDNVYSDVKELEEHITSHNINAPYSCGGCERRFHSSTYLMLHQSYDIKTESNNLVTSNQINVCDVSGTSSQGEDVSSCVWKPNSDKVSANDSARETFQESPANGLKKSDNMFTSYVKLCDIAPLLSGLVSTESSVINAEDEANRLEEACEYLSGLPQDLNQLTLCMSCCFPFPLSTIHTCQYSPHLMSKKCGFCEVVFNNKSSLHNHVQKIHKNKHNFCCILCSTVLTKEKDYIQHIINRHRQSNSKPLINNHSQPTSKSRRLKGSPQKIIPSYHEKDKDIDSSDEDDYLRNKDVVCYSDNDDGTSKKGKENCDSIDGNISNSDEPGVSTPNQATNGAGIFKHALSSSTTVNRPPRKRELIAHATSQHSVCHNCCCIVKDVVQHMKLHSYQERLKCGFCRLSLKTEIAARHHYRNGHKERNKLSCNSCKWYGVSEKRYIKHCLSVHKEDMNITTGSELPLPNSLSFLVNPENSQTHNETLMVTSFAPNLKTQNGSSSICRYCAVVCENISEHMKTHQPQDFRWCGFCKKKFSHRDKVSYHFRKSHKDRQNLFCQFCKEFRGSEEKYIEHFLQNHPNGVITNKPSIEDVVKSDLTMNGDWNQDRQQTNDPSLSRTTQLNGEIEFSALGASVANHSIVNEEVNELRVCKHCCKLYPIHELKHHMKGHSVEDKMHCGFCEKEFSQSDEVTRHQKVHHRKNIQCPFCTSEVSTYQNYIDHFLNCHYFDMKNGTLKSKLRLFVCEFCCEVHESRKLHYKTHTDLTVCGVCGQKYSRKETVRKHFECKHRDLKDVTCPFCPNFRGSVSKYIKHYLENHKKGFDFKEIEFYDESEGEDIVTSKLNDGNLSRSDDDDEDSQKYFVCEFCSEIHKSLTEHYKCHTDFTVCGFCGIELATKRNIQRHYAMKHKLKKEVSCRLCNVVIGSEKMYIDHYLQEHKGGESSDEDDSEAILCRQIESAFNASNLEEFAPEPSIINTSDVLKRLPTLKISKRLISTDDKSNEIETAKRSTSVHKLKLENPLGVEDMFSDEDSDSNFVPDFMDGYDSDLSDRDGKTATKPAISETLMSAKSDISHQDRVPSTDGMATLDNSDTNITSGSVFPSFNIDRQTEKRQTTSPQDDNMYKSQHSSEDCDLTVNNDKAVCIYCSKVLINLTEHFKTHSPADFEYCGFCKKRYPNKRYLSVHYRLCHKNKENLRCRFCKNFKNGSEKSYVNHFLEYHNKVTLDTSAPESEITKADEESSAKKPDKNSADTEGLPVKKKRRVRTGMYKDISYLCVCHYCGEVYGKKGLDIHIKKHSKDALQHCGFCNETMGVNTSVLDHYRSEHKDKEKVQCRICSNFTGSQEGYIRHYCKYHRSEGNQNHEETIPSFPLKDIWKYNICEFCGGIYRGLQRHYQTHTDNEFYSCGICGVTLAARNSVLRHFETVHKKHNDFSCKQCQVNVGSEERYIKHRLQQHLITSENKVNDHKGDEDGAKEESLCNKRRHEEHGDSSDHDNYSDEQTKEPVTYQCEICNEVFSHQYLLKLHRKCHTEDKQKCDMCDFSCYGESGLQLHKRRAHNMKIEKKCEVCAEAFSTHKAYITHIKSSHDGYFPHPCPDCCKKFLEKKSLANHIKKFHCPDAKFRYTCKTCNKGFDYKGSYTIHLRLHSNDRPFVCEVCGKGFRNKITLKVHQNIHTDNRPYKCKFCGKGFRQSSTEQNHRRIHTGEKPYMCHICGKSFHDRGHFHAHKKSSHKNELGLSSAPTARKPPNAQNSTMPIFPNGYPSYVVKEPPREDSGPYSTEVNSAVHTITEASGVSLAHQQQTDYQNYFTQMVNPHYTWSSHAK